MEYTREQVLRIVDACFHAYASFYRTEAEEEAIEIMERMELLQQTEEGGK